MPINASPEYLKAEKQYLQAQTTEEQISCLEEVIRTAPKHKGTENLLKELKTRLKKLREKSEKSKKSGKAKKGIKKEHYQCVLIGLPNSGKSSLLSKLTNAHPKITSHPFTTTHPEIGTLDYEGIKSQIIDMPSIGSENLDQSMINTADCIIIIIESLQDIEKISPSLKKATSNKIIALNKSDIFSENETRKLKETIKSKKLNSILISCKTSQGINELKQKIISQMNIIRIYTKEPGKPKTKSPIVLPQGSTVKDVAEKILKGFSQKIKETHLTGPSSKFPNQRVGLSHILKDKDVVEFHTK